MSDEFVTKESCGNLHGNTKRMQMLIWTALGTAWAAILGVGLIAYRADLRIDSVREINEERVKATTQQFLALSTQIDLLRVEIRAMDAKLDEIQSRLPAKP